MTLMVQELLDLSRIESGELAPVLNPVPVEDLLVEAVDRLRPQAERAGIDLSVDLPDGLPLVLADHEKIGRVLSNLIHNATKFTPSGGSIVVGARATGDQVTMSVADNGVGISPQDLPRIFERFYKVDSARSGIGPRQASSGTGLGLAIAKHIVQSHHGSIWAESRPGQGARFFFTLPVASPAVGRSVRQPIAGERP
jgi:two-component system phosphate regulon sensor histidine kinase PhoR